MTTSSRKALRDRLKELALEIRIPRDRRIFVTVDKAKLRETIVQLTCHKTFTGIATITGIDDGNEIEAIYHFTRKDLVLSLKTRVSKEEPVLPTITDIIPGSAFYEREVHDLFGIQFEGNPDLSPLLLPDHWPSDVYPLRREWNAGKIREGMGGD